MQCDEAAKLLSAHFDGELPPPKRKEVQEHVATCAHCRSELASFQRLSDLAAALDRPASPNVWAGIQASLPAGASASSGRGPAAPGRRLRATLVAVAASLLLAALGWWGVVGSGLGRPKPMSAQLAPYFAEFATDPDRAQKSLSAAYTSRPITFERAEETLKFRPAASGALPPGYAVQSVRLFDMPCCQCLQTILRAANGETVCIFEHDGRHPLLPSDQPCIVADCRGRPTTVTQLEGRLAASWSNGDRAVTLAGPRRLEDLLELVAALEENSPGEAEHRRRTAPPASG